MVGQCCCAASLFLRQRLADFEAFRQLAEQGGLLFGQNAGQPMSHAGQDGIASARGLKLTLPEGMMGKHGLGAVGEFVRERFRDRCPKIIARLIEDAPSQIQRTITGLLLKLTDFSLQTSTFCLLAGRC